MWGSWDTNSAVSYLDFGDRVDSRYVGDKQSVDIDWKHGQWSMDFEGLQFNGTDIYSDKASHAVINTASVWMMLPAPEFGAIS